MKRASGDPIGEFADPRDSEESRYPDREMRDHGSRNLRISTIESQAAYIRAYNRYMFGFDIQA